jgi:hypothetical protein
MSYSIHWYACNAEELRHRIASDHSLIDLAIEKARTIVELSPSESLDIRTRLQSGLQGDWRGENEIDGFIAFHWLLESVAEPILVAGLIDFRHWTYWESIRLDRYFNESRPPFSVPNSREFPPAVLYLPCHSMPMLLSVEAEKESVSHQSSSIVRSELLEIIESLNGDGLDLIGVAI